MTSQRLFDTSLSCVPNIVTAGSKTELGYTFCNDMRWQSEYREDLLKSKGDDTSLQRPIYKLTLVSPLTPAIRTTNRP